MSTKTERLNEYAVVRLDKAVSGIPGDKMETFDPRRVRYYVRAFTITEATGQLKDRFPDENKFAALLITENVKPYFKDEEVKRAA